MFGSNSIDTFYCRKDAQGFTVSAYCQIFLTYAVEGYDVNYYKNEKSVVVLGSGAYRIGSSVELDAQGFTVSAYCQIFLFHVAGRVQYEAGNLEVRESINTVASEHPELTNYLYMTYAVEGYDVNYYKNEKSVVVLREFVEVQTVAHIVVSRNRFGVVVDHDRLVTQFAL